MPNVLVIDDSPIDRILVEGILKRDSRMKTTVATNGLDGLAKMEATKQDVVITDLQMPEMDGLQLVTAIRLHYPHVPVVLITAHGSEDLAIRALEQGAASYVPKSQVAEKLLDSVDQVLDLAKSDRSYELLASCMQEANFRFDLANDGALLERLVELVQQISTCMGLCDVGGQVRLGMALEEALRMCLYRGNLELSEADMRQVQFHRGAAQPLVEERRRAPGVSDRKLLVAVQLSPAQGLIAIRHEGPPLNWLEDSSPEATAHDGLGDRSLILMKAFVDEVWLDPAGQQLELRIHGPRSNAPTN
ncbi:Nitrogen regulation protein NR(I) [Anatilimnocola aggregata]|uniref:Nitrogen regulation protein NR(I) n=1 Tax=Anatilimnocola aggregata TaxID=2528021 RepID=A0A517YBW1_9BACT|nr:response regulator [Anatilimnocola aggregata]QDU27730.1 Nitrogen regulation protein NR(I) [Anatilimnocola aggregata]